MNKNEVIADIVNCCIDHDLLLPEQHAYVIATADWESNHTFKPVREAYWLSEEWRKHHLRYYPYYGRGFVQVTWRYNYERFSDILNLDLVNNPDLALDYDVALQILVYGFKHGTFTGRELEKYINKDKIDFYNARRCINGLNKAETIAEMAQQYLKEL